MRAFSPAVHRLAANLRRPAIPADGAAILTGISLLFAGYSFAFAATLDQPILRSVYFAAVNTLGACAAGLFFHPLIARFTVERRARAAAPLHALLAAAFAIAWYFCTLAGYAIAPDWINDGLRVAPFGPAALSWQMFQGVTVYAVLALFIYWRHALRALERQRETMSSGQLEPALGGSTITAKADYLLIRCEKEMVPIAASELVRISGMDGYSEVVTSNRRILSTTSLARFEELLPGDQFVRAHRSHIVRLAAVRHAELAGNARLLLHLEDGEMIMTSRTGARRLRELTV
jgi:hypothetical protein